MSVLPTTPTPLNNSTFGRCLALYRQSGTNRNPVDLLLNCGIYFHPKSCRRKQLVRIFLTNEVLRACEGGGLLAEKKTVDFLVAPAENFRNLKYRTWKPSISVPREVFAFNIERYVYVLLSLSPPPLPFQLLLIMATTESVPVSNALSTYAPSQSQALPHPPSDSRPLPPLNIKTQARAFEQVHPTGIMGKQGFYIPNSAGRRQRRQQRGCCGRRGGRRDR